MPRFPRKHIKTSFFHVITQGINKSYIFDKSEDIKYYIRLIYKLSKEHEIEIIAYCIMNNHAHMLIKTKKSDELSKYMQRLNCTYARYYNKKYDRVGYVFRDRYKSEGIYDEQHLYNCIKYIYDNPVKAGICSKAKDYPYSNYKIITKEIKENYTFMDIDNDPKICKELIQNFLNENDMDINDLKKNKRKLKELIVILKMEYNISLRKISEETKIGRETIRKTYIE